MNPPEPNDPLSSALREWSVQPRRTPEFRAAVWRKIGAGGANASWSAYLRGNVGVVAAALAVAVVFGAVAGREQARTRVAAANTQLAGAYVQGLDARRMSMP